jgi:hypothetical protein
MILGDLLLLSVFMSTSVSTVRSTTTISLDRRVIVVVAEDVEDVEDLEDVEEDAEADRRVVVVVVADTEDAEDAEAEEAEEADRCVFEEDRRVVVMVKVLNC